MNSKSIVILIFAFILVFGGVMGYIKVGSYVSIITALVFACGLITCALLIQQGNSKAYKFAILLTLILLAFFGYRFSQNFQLMPGGLMTLLSCLTCLYLIICKPMSVEKQ